MEHGVKAGHDRQLGRQFTTGLHQFEVVGLVQRCQRNQCGQLGQFGVIKQQRLAVLVAAVNDTMAGGNQAGFRQVLTHPLQYFLQRKLVALLVGQALAIQFVSIQYLVLLVTNLEQGGLAQQVFHLEVNQAV